MRKIISQILILALTYPSVFALGVGGIFGGAVGESTISVLNASTISSDKTLAQSSTDNAVLAFTLGASAGTDRITALYILLGGTCVSSDFAASGVKFYEDVNNDSEWDAGDTLLGSASFVDGLASITSLTQGITPTSNQFIVTYDFAAGATEGCTATGTIAQATTLNYTSNISTAQATLTVTVPAFSPSDSFTDSDGVELQDHTSTSGDTWIEHSSSGDEFTHDSNAVIPAGNGVGIILYYIDVTPPSADYEVEALVFAGGERVGVAGRIDTTAETYYSAVYLDAWYIRKFVTGTESSLGFFIGDAPTSTAKTVKLEMAGTTIKLFSSGIERISVTDSDISAAGRSGIVSNKGFGPSPERIDDFVAAP